MSQNMTKSSFPMPSHFVGYLNIPTRLLLCSAHDERGFPGYRELSKTDRSNAFPLPNVLPLPNAQVDLAVWVS